MSDLHDVSNDAFRLTNRLLLESRPYLQQQADNTVERDSLATSSSREQPHRSPSARGLVGIGGGLNSRSVKIQDRRSHSLFILQPHPAMHRPV